MSDSQGQIDVALCQVSCSTCFVEDYSEWVVWSHMIGQELELSTGSNSSWLAPLKGKQSRLLHPIVESDYDCTAPQKHR